LVGKTEGELPPSHVLHVFEFIEDG
jgi:hypothetical protein